MGTSLSARRRALVFSGTGIALVAASLAVADFLSSLLFARVDLSAGKVYSISSGTKAVLGSLTDNLIVKVYFTPNLPPPYGLNQLYLRDLLDEYKNAGRGNVKLEFLNPEGDEKIKQEAMSAGVLPVRISVMARDKFEVKEAFMGLALLYNAKSEIIPVVQSTADLEYDITRRVKKISSPGMKTVGVVAGHDEKGPGGPMQPIFDLIGEQMNVEMVPLNKPFAPNLDALWIFGPTKPYAPAEIEKLKAWVASGKSLGLFLDRRTVDMRSFSTRPNNTGLEALLAAWGVQPKDGFVQDQQSQRIQVQQRQGFFTIMNVIEYPFIPIATSVNAKHPATRGLDAVVFPFVHPIVVDTQGKPLKYTSLIDSSALSWYGAPPSVSPFQPVNPSDQKGPFSLAGVLEGDFFAVTPATAAATAAPGRVILVGTSRMIEPNFTAKTANMDALMNLLEWSLQDEALLSIRAKGMTFRPLPPLGDAARLAVKNGLIFFLPAALLAAALAAYRRQKLRRRRLRALYAQDAAPEPVAAP